MTITKFSDKRPVKRFRNVKLREIKYGSKECPRTVFNKGIIIPGKDPDMWRLDFQGKVIKFTERNSFGKYGWNIDHNIPRASGGSDLLYNLFPLNWKDNIKFSNKLTEERKTYKRRVHFTDILLQIGENARKMQKKKLVVGSFIQARQSPKIKVWRQAEVISADKTNDCVEIFWVDGKNNELLVYDDRLFDF